MEEEFKYLVRVAGNDLDGNKKAMYAVTKIKGIGRRLGRIACELAGIDPHKKAGYLSDKEAKDLEKVIENFSEQNTPSWLLNRKRDYNSGKDMHLITSELLMSLREDVNRLKKIRSYRGIRHERGLPVRGQRTKSSFRKGTTVGVSRRKMAQVRKESKRRRER
ncbi:MAG: 30S ribosomal protein S13 [Candidatus Hydrothermarchaeales archaeon]